jgi:putative membrane-bound dehydrogenase-like protein
MRVLLHPTLGAAIVAAAGLSGALTQSSRAATPATAAPPALDRAELVRYPAVEPANAVGTFKVRPGFHLELVAAEPLVVDPNAIAFDEDGRLYVVEMIGYSERREDDVSRVRRLEDTDGDGRFDRSTVFADRLKWPTGIVCYDGGVFVGDTPNVYYMKDTNGDGVADIREVAFKGFGSRLSPEKYNVQQLLNSFSWGLDNRIHGAASGTAGDIEGGGITGRLNVAGRDFSFDPRTRTMRTESGGAQYGMSFDDTGRKFMTSNSDHLQTTMFPDRYIGRNPAFAAPRSRVSIADDGPGAEVYRASPDEPWRIIRTRWRKAADPDKRMEGGGRVSGYFTGATGATIYRGDAFPADFQGDAFIADIGGNLVHRKKVYGDGVELHARRPDDEQRREFIASADTWFRPTQFANAPDGTLYIIDMYREIIEHPWSLPEPLKSELNLNNGNDRGRIYRVVPDGFKPRQPVRLGRATTAELVALLEHPNGWHRDTAARLLYQRQDKSAAPAIAKLLATSASPRGRLHALYALEGQAALTIAQVRRGLADPDETVREHAARLSESFIAPATTGGEADELWRELLRLAQDPSRRVRYQLAFSLGETSRAGRIAALAQIVAQDYASQWVHTAALSSLAEGAGELFATLVAREELLRQRAYGDFLGKLALVIGAQNRPADVAALLAYVEKAKDGRSGMLLLSSLFAGSERAGFKLGAGAREKAGAKAAAIAFDVGQPLAARQQALQLLGLAQPENWADARRLLAPAEPEALQLDAIRTMGRSLEPAMATGLLAAWPTLTARVRTESIKVLVARPERARALLKAVEAGQLRSSDLASTQVEFLKQHRDAGVKEMAQRIFSTQGGSRQEVVKAFSAAIDLPGDAKKGHAIFSARCAACHRLGGEGFALGPDLTTVSNSGRAKLLYSILDPNAEVAPAYVFYTIETKSGESILGLVAGETASGLTVKQADGNAITVLRSNIASMRSLERSMMAEGLEAGLKPQDVADLLTFVENAR